MKISNYIIATVASTCLLAGCKKGFLDSYPATQQTEATFFNTYERVNEALVGCYNGMRGWSNDAGNYAYNLGSELKGDHASGGGGISDGLTVQVVDRFDKDIMPGNVNIYGTVWNRTFVTLGRCNDFLKRAEGFAWDDNSAYARSNNFTKAGATSEARFIRAYINFCSMQLWGHLPLLTETTVDPGVERQAAPQDVYGLIVDDLKYAIANLPTTYAANMNGRITKYAAEAMLARVYLYYTGYYGKTAISLPRVDKSAFISHMSTKLTEAEVRGYVQDVMTNGGFDLVSDFRALWPAGASADGVPYAGEMNNEIVFAIKYGYTNETKSVWTSNIGARSYNMPPYGRGWSIAIANITVWDGWDDDDKRKRASMLNVLTETSPFTPGLHYDDHVAGLDVREYQHVFFKKYLNQTDANAVTVFGRNTGDLSSMHSSQDFFIIRYADVLLMAAELGIDAQANFNRVRNRAYGGTAPAKEASYENIMEERGYEFVGEGLRYWDLLRMGLEKAADFIEVGGDGRVVRNGPNLYGTNNILIKRDKFMGTFGLSQIPETQIALSSGAIVQNEGWQ